MTAGSALPRVVAVVVTYHPQLPALAALLEALAPQVAETLIVDNGSGAALAAWLEGRHQAGLRLIGLGSNQGVAAAQNRGIREAREAGAEHVLLFDQDSVPAADMVGRLLEALSTLAAAGRRVAAVGPRYIDARNPNRNCFPRVAGLRFRMLGCAGDGGLVETDALISSGTLIPLNTLAAVGDMDESLFIDQVDLEWGLRARSRGHASFGVCAAVLHHALGEEPLRFLGRAIMHHGWRRHYYIFRNATRLLGRGYVPLGWKLMFLRMMLLRLGFYGLFVPPRFTYLGAMLRGIGHGLLGRGGPLPGG